MCHSTLKKQTNNGVLLSVVLCSIVICSCGSTVERPKMPVSTVTTVTLNRPAVVVQGVVGSPSIVTGLASGTVRTLLPGAIRVSSATAIPVMR